jgi:hypothetical protein
MLLTLTGQAVALRSDKPFVTTEDSAQVEIRVLDDSGRPVRGAQVSLTVNTGSVSEPVAASDGTFRATYQPSSQPGAQVALFHAMVKQGAQSSGAWLALPVHGPYTLRVQAPPRSRVRVTIGAASYGPVTATAKGEALVPVKVPPGLASAQVSIERSGKSRTQTVPLPEPRFARVQLVAPETPVQGQPVRLQGFVVDDSGDPAVALPPLVVSTNQGTLGPIEPLEGGVFEIPYTAAAPSGAPANISASPLEDSNRTSTLQVEPRPAHEASQPAPGPKTPDAPVAVAGSSDSAPPWRPWEVTVAPLLFLHTNGASANGVGVQLEGALRLGELPWEALLQAEFCGNVAVTETLFSEGPNPVTRKFTLSGVGLRLGARWSHALSPRTLIFADASLGVLGMKGTLNLTSTSEGTVSQQLKSTGAFFGVGAGIGRRVGPGRLCGQLQWTSAPGRNQVSGNLGGLSLGVGYQLVLGRSSSP